MFRWKENKPSEHYSKNTSLFIHNNHFCIIKKSNDNSFNQAIKELKLCFEVIDNVISYKHVESFVIYEYKPKKVQSPLTNIIVYDLETFNKVRSGPYCSCFYKLSEISGKYHRDITEKDYQKCLNDCVVFKGSGCINEMLDHVLSFKGEPKKSKIKLLNKIYM